MGVTDIAKVTKPEQLQHEKPAKTGKTTKVSKLAAKVKKMSPVGQALVGAVLEAADPGTPAQQAKTIIDNGRMTGKKPEAIADELSAAGHLVFTAGQLILRGQEVADSEPDLRQQIIDQSIEIQETKRRMKALREMQAEHLEQMPEWQELEAAKLQMQGKIDKLKIALSQDSVYNDRQEDIAHWRLKLNDQEDILSLHLVHYRDEEEAQTVEFGDKERPIVLKAKLGKERDIQIEMDFGAASEN